MAKEVKEMLFMNKGDGENSYVKSSGYTVPKLTNGEGLPLNKGKIYISKTSLPAVSKAYLSQFQQDFLSFLRCRSSEMVTNGRMVLIIHGRETKDPADRDGCYVWEVLADAISYMVSQGLIDEEKLDSFNVPYYIASRDEVEDLVKKEGSFTTEFMDIIVINTLDITRSTPEFRAKNLRAFTEPIISYQFGEEIMDKLYDKVKEIIVEDSKLGKESTMGVSTIPVLKKIK
ncbi:SAM dependent carboxyl methyltransferase [Corchorus olitorius]|uniref:SAM dependent carboxyl methyltransferase n=1 Tax=Corchorus olitorius TaxID=93759 RepID=A0A1R3I0S9_9ROSI|nr:SAM dependent carboxyl methyltransferase [Corchorus olitorius]